MDDAMLLELQEEAVLFVEDDGFEGFKAVKCTKQPLDVQILRQLFLAFLEVCLLSVFYCVLWLSFFLLAADLTCFIVTLLGSALLEAALAVIYQYVLNDCLKCESESLTICNQLIDEVELLSCRAFAYLFRRLFNPFPHLIFGKTKFQLILVFVDLIASLKGSLSFEYIWLVWTRVERLISFWYLLRLVKNLFNNRINRSFFECARFLEREFLLQLLCQQRIWNIGNTFLPLFRFVPNRCLPFWHATVVECWLVGKQVQRSRIQVLANLFSFVLFGGFRWRFDGEEFFVRLRDQLVWLSSHICDLNLCCPL